MVYDWQRLLCCCCLCFTFLRGRAERNEIICHWIRCHHSMILRLRLRLLLLRCPIHLTIETVWILFDLWLVYLNICRMHLCLCRTTIKCTFYHSACTLLAVHLRISISIRWKRKKKKEKKAHKKLNDIWVSNLSTQSRMDIITKMFFFLLPVHMEQKPQQQQPKGIHS